MIAPTYLVIWTESYSDTIEAKSEDEAKRIWETRDYTDNTHLYEDTLLESIELLEQGEE